MSFLAVGPSVQFNPMYNGFNPNPLNQTAAQNIQGQPNNAALSAAQCLQLEELAKQVSALQQQVSNETNQNNVLRMQNAAILDELMSVNNQNLNLKAGVTVFKNQNANFIKEKTDLINSLKDHSICPVCRDLTVVPKVVGACGHIFCEPCLENFNKVSFDSQLAQPFGFSAGQLLSSRKCPECRETIVGAGFPVHPLKNITATLISLDPSLQADAKELAAARYKVASAEDKLVQTLQTISWGQSELAISSVDKILEKVIDKQWENGVYILFEKAVSRIFFERFATTLHGKHKSSAHPQGLYVLVDAAQRKLAVQFANNRTPEAIEHLIIKIGINGTFSFKIPNSPVPSAELQFLSSQNPQIQAYQRAITSIAPQDQVQAPGQAAPQQAPVPNNQAAVFLAQPQNPPQAPQPQQQPPVLVAAAAPVQPPAPQPQYPAQAPQPVQQPIAGAFPRLEPMRD